MSRSSKLLAIWLVGSLLAVVMAMNYSSSSFTGEEWLPVGNDSFYHGARILDTVEGDRGFYQFDETIHTPEGSWLTWPWAYDYLMAQSIKAVQFVDPELSTMGIAVHIPTIWVLVNTALMVAICATLSLPLLFTTLVIVAYGCSPLTQALHGVGLIDHHYIEHTFVLSSLLFGLRWLQQPTNMRRAAAVGVVLGMAPAFHNGLFILQLPLLTAIGSTWLRGESPDLHATFRFAAALFGTTLLFLIPSEPFREGQFNFYVHSSFHLYISFATACLVVYMASRTNSRNGIFGLALLAIALATVIGAQIIESSSFFNEEALRLKDIAETASPYEWLQRSGGLHKVSTEYSRLIWFAPLLIPAFAWYAWKQRAPDRVFFATSVVFGITLMLMQFRMHGFGSFALLLGWLLLLAESEKVSKTKGVTALLCLFLIFAYYPAFTDKLFRSFSLANDGFYASTRPMFPVLAKRCKAAPGVVMASPDPGHHISYHTDCSVIANNFLMTPLHNQKTAEVLALLEMSPEEALEQRPDIRYFWARLRGVYMVSADETEISAPPLRTIKEASAPLFYQLIFRKDLPPNIRRIAEVPFNEPRSYPQSALFEVVPDDSSREE